MKVRRLKLWKPTVTYIIDVKARIISLFQENEQPKATNDIFISHTGISRAEPIDVQIDELGNCIIQVYQFSGEINDRSIPWVNRYIELLEWKPL